MQKLTSELENFILTLTFYAATYFLFLHHNLEYPIITANCSSELFIAREDWERMNYTLVLIINHCSHSQQGFEQPGETTALPSSSRGNLQQCKVFLSMRSHKALCGFLKNPIPLFPKRPVTFAQKSQRFHCDVGNRQHIHYRGNKCMHFCWTQISRIFALFFPVTKEEGMTFCDRVLLNLFSPCSDFSCKYVITVNASNAYTASKTVQNCSYCICWSIITNVMQRQVNCQCFSLGHFTFTQTPTA